MSNPDSESEEKGSQLEIRASRAESAYFQQNSRHPALQNNQSAQTENKIREVHDELGFKMRKRMKSMEINIKPSLREKSGAGNSFDGSGGGRQSYSPRKIRNTGQDNTEGIQSINRISSLDEEDEDIESSNYDDQSVQQRNRNYQGDSRFQKRFPSPGKEDGMNFDHTRAVRSKSDIETPNPAVVKRSNSNLSSNKGKVAKSQKKKLREGNSCSKICSHVLPSTWFQMIVNGFIVYALFGEYVNIISNQKRGDIYYAILTLIAIGIFLAEMVMSVIILKTYTFSFFFWIDLTTLLTLLLDLILLNDTFLQLFNYNIIFNEEFSSTYYSQYTRIIRLIRLTRIGKLYKATQNRQIDFISNISSVSNLQKTEGRVSRRSIRGSKDFRRSSFPFHDLRKTSNNVSGQQSVLTVSQEDNRKAIQVIYERPRESKVSRILTELATKRVIILVLVLMLVMPLFSVDSYFFMPTEIQMSVRQMDVISRYQSTEHEIREQYKMIQMMFQDSSTKLIKLTTPFSFLTPVRDPEIDILRSVEMTGIRMPFDLEAFIESHPEMTDEIQKLGQLKNNGVSLELIGIISVRDSAIITAALSFASIIFICIILTAGSLLFQRDAQDLALGPIERIRDKVVAIADDPLSSKKVISGEANNNSENSTNKKSRNKSEQYETKLIENAIIKIGTLLALGFGEAGSEIIAINMGQQGDVNPMIPGKKKCAIYGFCDIRNFTDATEILQEDVMLFVNNIGDVVHTLTDRYLGAANKNIGDAFLLVWRIDETKYTIQDWENQVVFQDAQYISTLADFSLLAFLRIQSQINRVPKLLEYRQDRRLQHRIPDYKVKMGYGLHIGWSIEGAIGSEFKIDASYLSPNVNMAGRLEATTKSYGVPLLISSDLHQHFSAEMRKYTRKIDRVMIKGQNQVFGLYTVDMNVDSLPPKKPPNPLLTPDDIALNQEKKEVYLEILESISEGEEEFEWDASAEIHSTKDLRLLFTSRNIVFQRIFEEGLEQYLNSNWKKAKQIFQSNHDLFPPDGPTKALLDFMQETDFVPPPGWEGYRMI